MYDRGSGRVMCRGHVRRFRGRGRGVSLFEIGEISLRYPDPSEDESHFDGEEVMWDSLRVKGGSDYPITSSNLR